MSADWKDMLGALRDGLPEDEPEPHPEQQPALRPAKVNKGKLKVFKEKKGRAGKTAIIITGFECSDAELQEIAATLKKKLGCGGSARGSEILIQGDKEEAVRRALKEL